MLIIADDVMLVEIFRSNCWWVYSVPIGTRQQPAHMISHHCGEQEHTHRDPHCKTQVPTCSLFFVSASPTRVNVGLDGILLRGRQLSRSSQSVGQRIQEPVLRDAGGAIARAFSTPSALVGLSKMKGGWIVDTASSAVTAGLSRDLTLRLLAPFQCLVVASAPADPLQERRERVRGVVRKKGRSLTFFFTHAL